MVRFALLSLFAVLFSGAALAHEGHDQGGTPAAAEAGPPRLEATGSALELVAVADGHALTIFLDRLATNEPVPGAIIEISGEGIPTATAKEVSPGLYELDAPWADEPGTKALIFTVTAGEDMDLLNGTLKVPAPEAAAPVAMPAWSTLLASPAAWLAAALFAVLGFLFAFAFRPARIPAGSAVAEQPSVPAAPTIVQKTKQAAEIVLVALLSAAILVPEARAHEGHDHGGGGAEPASGTAPRKLPGGEVFVPKPTQRLLGVRTTLTATTDARQGVELIGTVVPDPSSFGQVQAPMDGRIELAERGISYVGQRIAAGDVMALLTPTIPTADLGTMLQLRAEVEGKLQIARQKHRRLTAAPKGTFPQRDIDDTAAEIEALVEQKRVLDEKDTEKHELKAPVSGVISVANVRAGQVVSGRDTLFEIVDPEKLWIEAVGRPGHKDEDVVSAFAVDSHGHSIKLEFLGKAPTVRQQSLPLLFRVSDEHRPLTLGATVKIYAEGMKSSKGIVLPAAAVVRGSNGMPQVWEKLSPEFYKPVAVTTVPLDGERVLVTGGLRDGLRVVTVGAELINQVR